MGIPALSSYQMLIEKTKTLSLRTQQMVNQVDKRVGGRSNANYQEVSDQYCFRTVLAFFVRGFIRDLRSCFCSLYITKRSKNLDTDIKSVIFGNCLAGNCA